MNLISLVIEKEYLDQLIIDKMGELTTELELAIKENDIQLKEKIDAYVNVWDSIDAKIEQLESRTKLIQDKINILNTEREKLKTRLKISLGEIKQIKGNNSKIKVYTSNQRLDVAVDAVIPLEFMRRKIIHEIDKVELKKKIKEGLEIPGVKLTDTISIKKEIL
jgi:hypothetical protein